MEYESTFVCECKNTHSFFIMEIGFFAKADTPWTFPKLLYKLPYNLLQVLP